MPITPFLRGQAFDPETVEAMGTALVTTCDALGLSDRNDAMTQLVAEKDHRIGGARIKKSDRLAFGRDQGV
jgi:hypothetical protein